MKFIPTKISLLVVSNFEHSSKAIVSKFLKPNISAFEIGGRFFFNQFSARKNHSPALHLVCGYPPFIRLKLYKVTILLPVAEFGGAFDGKSWRIYSNSNKTMLGIHS